MKTLLLTRKKTSGFSIAETSFVIAAGFLLYLYFTPVQTSLTTQTSEAQKSKVTSEIEIAKNRFDQESTPKDKESFNNGNEKERFAKLAPFLKTANSETYFIGMNIDNCRINAIGTNVQVE